MKRDPLLLFKQKIEGCQWSNMVNVPRSPIVVGIETPMTIGGMSQ